MELAGGRVKNYQVHWDPQKERFSGLEDFVEMVTSDIRNLMEPQWRKLDRLTPLQKDLLGQWEFARQKARQFTVRHGLIERYQTLVNGGTNLFAIQGPSGSGKTTLMSKLAQELNRQVLPVFCGQSELCGTPPDVLRYILDFLETTLDLPHFAEQASPDTGLKEWQERLNEVAARFDDRDSPEVVILVDAVDQLYASEKSEKLCFIPSRLPSRMTMILSCLDGFPLDSGIPVESVPVLTKSDREEIIRGIVASTGKKLSDEVIRTITEKEGGDNPLYLSLLITRLQMMDRHDFEAINRQGGGMNDINRHQIEIIGQCPSRVEDICVYLIKKVVRKKLKSFLPYIASDLIAVSRYGLRPSDLEDAINIFGRSIDFLKGAWNTLTFTRFLRYMDCFFIRRDDGRIDFTHQVFRKGFLAGMAAPEEKHDVLLEHFSSLWYTDEVGSREIGYHCIRADQKAYFISYTSQAGRFPEVLQRLADSLISASQLDHARWITGLIRDGERLGWNRGFTRFLFENVLDRMIPSAANLKLTAQILEEMRELLEKKARKSNSIDDKRDLAACLIRLAVQYRTSADPGHLHTALLLANTAMQIHEEIFAAFGSPNSRRSLSIGYEQVGLTLATMGGRDHLLEAVRFLERSLEHRRILCTEPYLPSDARRGLLLVLNHLGDVYCKLGGQDHLRKASEYYRESIHISDISFTRRGDRQTAMDLAGTYAGYADILMQTDSTGSSEALKHIERSIALFRELEESSPGTDLLLADNLSLLLMRAARIQLEMGGRDHLLAAKKAAQDALKYKILLHDQLNTPVQESDLALNYCLIGDICQELGGIWDGYAALSMYEKSMEKLMHLAAYAPTEDVYARLLTVMARIINHFGTSRADRLEYIKQMQNTANAAFALTANPRYRHLAEECQRIRKES